MITVTYHNQGSFTYCYMLLALMCEASPGVLVFKFSMVLELQTITFENANFDTKMDFFP